MTNQVLDMIASCAMMCGMFQCSQIMHKHVAHAEPRQTTEQRLLLLQHSFCWQHHKSSSCLAQERTVWWWVVDGLNIAAAAEHASIGSSN